MHSSTFKFFPVLALQIDNNVRNMHTSTYIYYKIILMGFSFIIRKPPGPYIRYVRAPRYNITCINYIYTTILAGTTTISSYC